MHTGNLPKLLNKMFKYKWDESQMDMLEEICDKWERIAKVLGVPTAEVEAIKARGFS